MPGPKEKAAPVKKRPRFGARQRIRASVLTRGRRIAQAPIWASPSGTLSSSARGRDCCPVADGADSVGCVHSTRFSFCAFRRQASPASSLGAQRGREKRGRESLYPPGWRFPQGRRRFRLLTAARDCQPSPAGGLRDAPAQADPPNMFSFPPGAAHFLFDVSKRKWGAHPLRERNPPRPPFGGPSLSLPGWRIFFKSV